MNFTPLAACRKLFSLPTGSRIAVLAAMSLAGLAVACGTDFVEPPPVAARGETPVPQATVLRVIEVTPIPTPTPLPTAIGPDGKIQRAFPSEIDPSRAGDGLPPDLVIGYWREYLSDSRVIVEDLPIDVHVCADGNMVPGSPDTFVAPGRWGLRPANGEWYQVFLGSEFRPGRISGLVRLTRVGGSTAAIGEDGTLHVISVTDSDVCAQMGGS